MLSGVAQPVIAAAESGRSRLSRQARQHVEEALEVRPSALLRAASDELLSQVEAHGCELVGALGSIAPGSDRPSSDVDLVVRFPRDAGVVDLLELEEGLSELLTVPVDAISSEPVPWSGTVVPLDELVRS